MNESVEKERAYVAAYVDYIEYVERLITDASGAPAEDGSEPAAEAHH